MGTGEQCGLRHSRRESPARLAESAAFTLVIVRVKLICKSKIKIIVKFLFCISHVVYPRVILLKQFTFYRH